MGQYGDERHPTTANKAQPFWSFQVSKYGSLLEANHKLTWPLSKIELQNLANFLERSVNKTRDVTYFCMVVITCHPHCKGYGPEDRQYQRAMW